MINILDKTDPYLMTDQKRKIGLLVARGSLVPIYILNLIDYFHVFNGRGRVY